MDIFFECMVKKEKRFSDILKIAGILVGVLVLLLAITLFLGAYGFLLDCGAIYGGYWLITREDIEFEYILTNSVLDVDKIMAKRSRKRILSVDLNEANSMKIARNIPQGVKIIDASPRGIEDGVYMVEFSKKGERKILLFKPNEKILSGIKASNPKLIEL